MTQLNSLAPGKFEWNFRYVNFKWILMINGWDICCEIALIWMSSDFIDDQSTLVQVMAWCRQATSHYLSQCWPRSLSPYGVTRPELANRLTDEWVFRKQVYPLEKKLYPFGKKAKLFIFLGWRRTLQSCDVRSPVLVSSWYSLLGFRMMICMHDNMHNIWEVHFISWHIFLSLLWNQEYEVLAIDC